MGASVQGWRSDTTLETVSRLSKSLFHFNYFQSVPLLNSPRDCAEFGPNDASLRSRCTQNLPAEIGRPSQAENFRR
jgi:hypothetical protein